jgi:Kdo2-lipid IVA lauroyltransferase/acyltransferase
MTILLRLLARLPLSWLHAAGTALGWAIYLLSPRYAARTRENLLFCGVWQSESEYENLLNRSIAESGKAALEVIAVWFRPLEEVRKLVRCEAPLWPIENAEALGKGVIYLTPHLGCFEATGHWLSGRGPLTALYRPPKIAALEPYIKAGRKRGPVSLAPANLAGVRMLLKALKRGESIFILPDQAPGAGEGAWAKFFGRDAYTMTLVGRLVEASGAPVIMIAGQRLLGGVGYTIHMENIVADLTGEGGPRNLNAAVENFVRRMPEQYLWSYNRYKVPAGVTPPAENSVKDNTHKHA